MTLQTLALQLQKELAVKHPNLRFSDPKMLTGGASALSLEVNVEHTTSSKTSQWIIRAASPGQKESSTALSLPNQSLLLQTLQSGEILTPTILHPDFIATPGFAMKFIHGYISPTQIIRVPELEKARSKLAFQCGQQMALIHKTPIASVEKIVPRTSTSKQVESYDSSYQACGVKRPVLSSYFKYLQSYPLPQVDPVLVHGDFRNGNIVVDQHGLSGILDWELAHIGNPLEDLGWICCTSWRFSHPKLTVGGFGEIEQLIEGYLSIHPQAKSWCNTENILRWADWSSVKWGIICLTQGISSEDATDPGIKLEKLAIGRRVHETEFDIAYKLCQHNLSLFTENWLGKDFVDLWHRLNAAQTDKPQNLAFYQAIDRFKASLTSKPSEQYFLKVAKRLEESLMLQSQYNSSFENELKVKLQTISKDERNQPFSITSKHQLEDAIENGQLNPANPKLWELLLWDAVVQLAMSNHRYPSLQKAINSCLT